MNILTPTPLLRTALALDGATSLLAGAAQVAAPDGIARWTGLPAPLLSATGLFLLVFGVVLLALSRRAHLPDGVVSGIVAGNVGWALACLALPAAGLVHPGPLGLAWLAVHVVDVLVWASLEHFGMKASTTSVST